jgi:hypothetical protein
MDTIGWELRNYTRRMEYTKTEFMCFVFHVANNVVLKPLSGQLYCEQVHLISSHSDSIGIGWCIVLSFSVKLLYSGIRTRRVAVICVVAIAERPIRVIHSSLLLLYVSICRSKVKSKAIPVTGRGGLWCCEMLRIPHCLVLGGL